MKKLALEFFSLLTKLCFRVKKMFYCVLFTYPPAGSPFYAQYQCVGIDLLEDHLLNLNINNDSYELLILGDVNARTGEKYD